MATVRKNSERKNFFLGPCPVHSCPSQRWVYGKRPGWGRGSRCAAAQAQAVGGREAAGRARIQRVGGHRAAGRERSALGCAASLHHPAPSAMSAQPPGRGHGPSLRVRAASLDTVPTAKALAASTPLADEAEAARTHPGSRFYLGPREKAGPHEDGADDFLLDWQTANACRLAPLCSHSRLAGTGGETGGQTPGGETRAP